MDFKDINQSQSNYNNVLVDKRERNQTILTKNVNVSTFDKSFQQATTFNSGYCIPILSQWVNPGDTYKISYDNLIRLSAQASTPLMNINYDVNFFFVPFTQIDPKFKNLMGENDDYGANSTNLEFPKIDFSTVTQNVYNENDLANYFNLPINKHFGKNYGLQSLNLYPFLAYGKIWNDWYRDQNLQSSIDITSVYANSSRILSYQTSKNNSFYTSIIQGKNLAPASKLPNYFTTSLPYQQKGTPISLSTNLGNLSISGFIKANEELGISHLISPIWFDSQGRYNIANKNLYAGNGNINGRTNFNTSSSNPTPSSSNQAFTKLEIDSDTVKFTGDIFPTITEMRYSLVYQHLLENWALCGSRYTEQLKSIWGIEIDPKEINRCELIGGYNDSLQFSNVVQTSQSTEQSQLGKIASNLNNIVNFEPIEYSASQHGIIIGILVARTFINNGGQGIPKQFIYNDFLDLHNPLFNNISEQPLLNMELYYDDSTVLTSNKNLETFGFNEPFLETKYNIDNANGFMSLNSKTSLFPLFLFGEKYNKTPLLSDDWIQFNSNIIGNTLYDVTDNTKEFYHQFIAIFNFNIEYTTQQPLFNKPGIQYI